MRQQRLGFDQHEIYPELSARGGENPFSCTSLERVPRRRDMGQVSTPENLARAMARWVLAESPSSILDPGVGAGALLYACRVQDSSARLVGVDRDEKQIQLASRYAPHGTKLVQADYLEAELGQFPAIIANPPYVKAHHLDLSEATWKGLEDRFRTRLDRLTNLYGLFLLKVWHDLAEGGRAAVLIPAEFLNANFGVHLKAHFLDTIKPSGLAVLDPARSAFNGASTTSCVVFLRKRDEPPPGLLYRHCRDEPDLDEFVSFLLGSDRSPASSRPESFAEWDPAEKWLNRIIGSTQFESSPFQCKVGDYFGCRRGIATGGNEYFCLTKDEARVWGLGEKHLIPCITKSSHAPTLLFRTPDFGGLEAAGRRCYLLKPTIQDATLRRYLAHGEALGIHRRHLPSHRPTWYMPEERPPADVWVGVFFRDRLKAVLNRAQILNLTCFHGLYARGEASNPSALVLFLNSSYSRQAWEQVNRFYGDGLLKLEPKDVEALPCPELPPANDKLADEALEEIQALLDRRADASEVQRRTDDSARRILGLSREAPT